MPLQPVFTSRFQKDVELAKRRGKDTDKLKVVILLLLNQRQLEARYHDHWLSGNHSNRRECHIEPDWLLIYKPDETSIIFERTGTHSDLY
jgi:mRNA interferase YafQ